MLQPTFFPGNISDYFLSTQRRPLVEAILRLLLKLPDGRFCQVITLADKQPLEKNTLGNQIIHPITIWATGCGNFQKCLQYVFYMFGYFNNSVLRVNFSISFVVLRKVDRKRQGGATK